MQNFHGLGCHSQSPPPDRPGHGMNHPVHLTPAGFDPSEVQRLAQFPAAISPPRRQILTLDGRSPDLCSTRCRQKQLRGVLHHAHSASFPLLAEANRPFWAPFSPTKKTRLGPDRVEGRPTGACPCPLRGSCPSPCPPTSCPTGGTLPSSSRRPQSPTQR